MTKSPLYTICSLLQHLCLTVFSSSSLTLQLFTSIFFPVCLSSFPQSNFPLFILVLMPRAVATAWNWSCLLNASPGELAVPAAQCGLSLWQRGRMPLAQLSAPLPLLGGYCWERRRERECFLSSLFSHPLWTSSISLRQRLFLSQGLECKTSLHHTCRRSLFPRTLLPLPFPLPLCKPPSGGFHQSLSQHHMHMQHKDCACFCEVLTMV